MLEWLKRQIFGPPDPTRDWKRQPGLRLRFDLDAATLDGLPLGSAFDRLSHLGGGDRKATFAYGESAWPDIGVAATQDEDGRIVEFRLHFLEGWWLSFQPCDGEIVHRGERIDLRELTLPSFQERFGKPYWIDEDEDEVLLFYEFSDREWQVEFRPDGRLACITIASEPLLADENSRRGYGVTKPWPPAGLAENSAITSPSG